MGSRVVIKGSGRQPSLFTRPGGRAGDGLCSGHTALRGEREFNQLEPDAGRQCWSVWPWTTQDPLPRYTILTTWRPFYPSNEFISFTFFFSWTFVPSWRPSVDPVPCPTFIFWYKSLGRYCHMSGTVLRLVSCIWNCLRLVPCIWNCSATCALYMELSATCALYMELFYDFGLKSFVCD